MAKGMISASAAAQKWQTRLAGSGDAIRAGVAAVTTAPGQLAAQKADLWLQNVTASMPRWKERVASTSLQDWQSAMVNKALPRISAGSADGKAKFEMFLGQWMPFMQQVRDSLPPRGNIDQNIARMEQQVRKAHEARGRFRQSGRAR